ncbi:hypothetical protein HK104_003536 [Borealophlyctis nickersoniae]|nr:hypothetical protein HK104_003536 [Borealophlyctis nickersoniae]
MQQYLRDPTTDTVQSQPASAFDPSLFEFMPLLVQILEKMARSTGEDETAEIGRLMVHKVSNLQDKIRSAHQVALDLPGIHLTTQEQERLYAQNTTTLEQKRNQLRQYVDLPLFAKVGLPKGVAALAGMDVAGTSDMDTT